MRMTPWPKPGSRPSRASSATDGRFPGYEHVEHETLHWIGLLRMKVIHEEAGLRQGHGLRKVGRFAAGGGWGCGGNAPVIHPAALGRMSRAPWIFGSGPVVMVTSLRR
jgi:hypothetical protein